VACLGIVSKSLATAAHTRRTAAEDRDMARGDPAGDGYRWSVVVGAGQPGSWCEHRLAPPRAERDVISGTVRLEFGPAGAEVLDGGLGDFIHVPSGAIHGESNPGNAEATTAMTRAGQDSSMYEVDGPDSI
jgi:hypothetical protein